MRMMFEWTDENEFKQRCSFVILAAQRKLPRHDFLPRISLLTFDVFLTFDLSFYYPLVSPITLSGGPFDHVAVVSRASDA